MSYPSIDHSLLSPSGCTSKRARKAALKRETEKLFPAGIWDKPEPTAQEITAMERDKALRHARLLRELAARGMHSRKYLKEAERIEKDWDSAA